MMYSDFSRLLAILLVLTSLGFVRGAEAGRCEVVTNVVIPAIDSSQYRRPYVAFWLTPKSGDQKPKPYTLNVWYEDKKWLRDLRKWWRKVGRSNQDIDGFSGATRPAGQYQLSNDVSCELGQQFSVQIEAVREHGNRSILKSNFFVTKDAQTLAFDAKDEIGPVSMTIEYFD